MSKKCLDADFFNTSTDFDADSKKRVQKVF